MDTFVLITLIAILLLFIYFLYYWVYNTKKVHTKSTVDLSASPASIDDIAEPGNTRYAYAAWVFVNNVNTNQDSVIFYRPNNLCVYLQNDSATLVCAIAGSSDLAKVDTVITDTFPLQRWVHILVSVDGQYIDYYLNGKLIKSEKKSYLPTTPSSGKAADGKLVSVPVYLGNSGNAAEPNDNINPDPKNTKGFAAFLTKFTHWTTPLGPQSVWSEYTSGNGGSYFPYSVRLDLLKNNNIQSSYQMW